MPVLVLAMGCGGPRQRALPAPLALPPPSDAVRLVLVGDTGVVDGEPPGSPDACEPDVVEGHAISADCRARMVAAMAAEGADAVVALGDLVYWRGPTCPTEALTDEARTTFDRVLGSGLGRVGPPVLLAMGNHDKWQRKSHPAAERCYLAYAAEHPAMEMPDLTYTAELGPVLLVVVDTARPPRGELAEALVAQIEAHRSARPEGWVIAAGHHPVRTYRDDTDQPRQMRGWADRLGVDLDLWASGHAHYLQLTAERGLPNVTSGAGGKHRSIAACPEERCGDDELWSWSDGWGYAVATATTDALEITFKDVRGETLYRWSRTHAPVR